MKKLLFSTTLILLLAGCSFQIPKTVTVKSNANYSFNILSYEKDLSNLLETEKFLDILSDGDKRKVYDYNPGGNSEFQQFLMEYPFYDAAIDFSEYTEDMKLDQVASSFSVDKEFTFSSQDQINSLIKPMGVKEMTVNGQPFDGSSFTFDLTQENAATNAKFKSIKYSAGTMRVYYKDNDTCTKIDLSTSLNSEKRSSSGLYSTGNKTVNIPGVGSYSFDKYYDIPFTPSGKSEYAFSDLKISFTGGVSAFYCEIIDGVIEGISASAQFDDFDPVIQQNVPLTRISESINSVTFAKGNGLKITYDNTLPEGNNILLKAGCDFLDIPADTPLTLTAGTTNETANLSGTTHNPHSLDPATEMEFTGTLYLPGVKSNATGEDLKKAILKDVKPGETYRIKISAEPVIKWSEVVVKVPDQDLGGTVDTGISLGTLLGDFLDDDSKSKLSFEGVETRIYLEKPNNAGNLFNSISFTGNINIKLNDDSRTENMTLSGFVDPVKLEKQGDTVITDVKTKPASAEKDLSDFLKSAVKSSAQVQLDYNITMGGSNVTITKTDYEAMTSGSNEKPHLRAVAYIIMPFKFKIDGSNSLNPDAKIDLNKIAGLGEDDILGRTSFGDNSAYDAAAMIEKVGVHFNMSNLPIYTNDNDFGVEFDLGTYNELGVKTSSPKHLALKGDTLKLSSEEIIDFIRYKTVPGLKVVLKGGKTYVLKRNANKVIKVNAGIDFHVDGYVKMGVGANGEAIDFGGAE